MFRVFDPTPTIRNGETIEFGGDDKYYVTRNGKRIKEGDVIPVDEDLMCMKHNPEKMMLALAKIRAVVRGSAHSLDQLDKIMEITKCL